VTISWTFSEYGSETSSMSQGVKTWIRRENAPSGLKRLQAGGPGKYRFREAFY
jgi:hypothetical protein